MFSPLKFIPLLLNVLEMLVDYFPYLSPVLRRQTEAEGFLQTEIVSVEPILAFQVAFSAVHMNRFVSLVRVEEKPPSEYEQDRRHMRCILCTNPVQSIDDEQDNLTSYTMAITTSNLCKSNSIRKTRFQEEKERRRVSSATYNQYSQAAMPGRLLPGSM